MEIKIYDPYLYLDNLKAKIEMDKFENWIRQFIPSDYLRYVQQIILVWDNEEQREWITSMGEQESDVYTQTKNWDLNSKNRTLGINDPDSELIILFLDAIWDTVQKLSQYVEIDSLVYMNRILLETAAHELRHIGQQNGLVTDFQYAEADAEDFGHDLYKAHLDSVFSKIDQSN